MPKNDEVSVVKSPPVPQGSLRKSDRMLKLKSRAKEVTKFNLYDDAELGLDHLI
jgi:hypothetical protein